jgi:hypothetical protein
MEEDLRERYARAAELLKRCETRVEFLLGESARSKQRSNEAFDAHMEIAHALIRAQDELKAAVQRERIARENLHAPRFVISDE